MAGKVRGFFFEATAFCIVGLVTWYFTPWFNAMFPDMPDFVSNAIPAFLIAFGVLLAFISFTATVQLAVRWHADGDLAIELSQINVKLDSNTGEGLEGYWISIVHVNATGLGRWVLQRAVEGGLQVKIAVPHTTMAMTPELDPRDPTLSRITPGNDCSIRYRLDVPIPEHGDGWGSVRVTFQGHTARPDYTWTLSHNPIGATWFARRCARLIKVGSKVVSLGENWR